MYSEFKRDILKIVVNMSFLYYIYKLFVNNGGGKDGKALLKENKFVLTTTNI